MENKTAELWGVYELRFKGPSHGNPFIDINVGATFKHKHRVIEVDGFYDGNGEYVVRFMPDALGGWSFETYSNCNELNCITGQFDCIKPSAGNHGMVRVKDTYHFGYDDGTPYYPIGTTAYAWTHQDESLEEETLKSLQDSPFNKIRMCVFPKNYDYNHNEPRYYPFEGSLKQGWDFTRFNPVFFRHLEKRINDLMKLGIEADLILFHPYDNGRWGFDRMDAKTDDRYLKYIIARLSAFRNIWWSLANEYDSMEEKTMADWDRFFRIIQTNDPYQHLRSIHQCRLSEIYDHTKPWVTHCSIQEQHFTTLSDRLLQLREQYKKPVILDEVGYEGNITQGWGSLTPQEMVRRFWVAAVGGGYAGHGETYYNQDEILWWSKGGRFYGQSIEKIAFLRRILEDCPKGLTPVKMEWDVYAAQSGDEHYIIYLEMGQPAFKQLKLPDGSKYKIEIIDTWEMTITPLEDTFEGECIVKLPGKQYIALRIKKYHDAEKICKRSPNQQVS